MKEEAIDHEDFFYFSNVSDPGNFNVNDDFFANDLGDTIIGMIPRSDGMLLVVCENQVNFVEGDPARGGGILPVPDVEGDAEPC